jgi:superfamily II DNA or RNA helicase
MEHLVITNVNESLIHIGCTDGVAMELFEAFSFRADKFMFHPLYKAKLWDGWIRIFQLKARTLYRGLAPDVIKWAEDRGYTTEYDGDLDTNFSLDEAREFITELNPSMPSGEQTRDYQENSFVHAIRSKRKIVISPTGSGKSLLAYIICNHLLKQVTRGLLIVPRSALVEQMYSDFEDYSKNNGKDISRYCHRIYSGKDKNTNKPIVISTWQSLMRMPAEWFRQFGYVIVDEVHQAQAKELTNIVTKCTNAEYRIGVTGTLSGAKAHEWVLKGLFGPVYRATSSRELMDRGQLSELKIKCLMLRYPDEHCLYMRKADYKTEISYIVGNEERNKFLCKLALSLDGNTMLMFNFVDHGEILYKMLNSMVKDGRKVFLIHGKTAVDEREQIRAILANESNAILVGSSGCLSSGTNIPSLANLIFAHPSKSKIRTLQSVGRALRVHKTKSYATLFDIVDDFSYKKRENYSVKHFIERLRIYADEKFQFKIYRIAMKVS